MNNMTLLKFVYILFLLLTRWRLCSFADTCKIVRKPPGSPTSLLTKSEDTKKDYRIRLGKDFTQLEIRLEVRNTWTFNPPFVVKDTLVLTRDDLSATNENGTSTILLKVRVFEKEIIGKDKLVLRAIVDKNVYDLDPSLWWTMYAFHKFSIHGTGQIILYDGCLPEEEESENDDAFLEEEYKKYKLKLLKEDQVRSIVTLCIAVVSLSAIIMGLIVFCIRRKKKHEVIIFYFFMSNLLTRVNLY